MLFASRKEAGVRLGELLASQRVDADIVLGMPRGGVVVAAEVARILRRPLDILVVRKIGHPWNREFAVGAIAEDGTVILDEDAIGDDKTLKHALQKIITEERNRLREYRQKFRRMQPLKRKDKAVLLVDDGLATGATAEAAVKVLFAQKANRVIVAVPVASVPAVTRLRNAGADVIAMVIDPDFAAVGQYYVDFTQTTDDEVLAILRENEAENK